MPGGKTAWNGKDEQGRATYEKIINRAKAAGFYLWRKSEYCGSLSARN